MKQGQTMFKHPRDTDPFKHFQRDPSDVKLQAWKLLQRHLTIRHIFSALVIPLGYLLMKYVR